MTCACGKRTNEFGARGLCYEDAAKPDAHLRGRVALRLQFKAPGCKPLCPEFIPGRSMSFVGSTGPSSAPVTEASMGQQIEMLRRPRTAAQHDIWRLCKNPTAINRLTTPHPHLIIKIPLHRAPHQRRQKRAQAGFQNKSGKTDNKTLGSQIQCTHIHLVSPTSCY